MRVDYQRVLNFISLIFEVFPTFCLKVWEHSHFVSENYQTKCLCTFCLIVWEHSHFVSENYHFKWLFIFTNCSIFADSLYLFNFNCLFIPIKPQRQKNIFSNVPLNPKPRESIMSIYIHKLLKLPRLDPNLLSLKTLAMSLFILTHLYNKSSLSINNTVHFRHIF